MNLTPAASASAAAEPAYQPFLTRNEVITAIRSELKRRSGKQWSVTGGRGTAYGWITISSPPKARENGRVTKADSDELRQLLNLEPCSYAQQGISVPSSSAYYREYMDRAAGVPPSVIGEPYWD